MVNRHLIFLPRDIPQPVVRLAPPMPADGGKEINLGPRRTHFLIGEIIGDGLGRLGRREVGGGPLHPDHGAEPTAVPAGREGEGRQREKGRVPDFQPAMRFVDALAGAQGGD